MAWEPLTPEQRELRDLVRTIARERIAPRAAEIDATHEFPWDIVEAFRDARHLRPLPSRGARRHRHGSLLSLVAIEEVSRSARRAGSSSPCRSSARSG
jgi:alkylation response protein AidB-like acyl-CoA dehydrogenase